MNYVLLSSFIKSHMDIKKEITKDFNIDTKNITLKSLELQVILIEKKRIFELYSIGHEVLGSCAL
jgi:hypothetical protein